MSLVALAGAMTLVGKNNVRCHWLHLWAGSSIAPEYAMTLLALVRNELGGTCLAMTLVAKTCVALGCTCVQ